MMTGDWSLGYTSVSGAEDICIGGQRLSVIFAPVFLIYKILLIDIGIVGVSCYKLAFSLPKCSFKLSADQWINFCAFPCLEKV